MHNRNSGEELANRVQPEVPPTTTTATITTTTTKVEPDVCLKVQANLIPLCVNNRLQASNVADNRHQCQTTTAVNKDKQRNFYAAVQQPLNDHDEQRAEVDVYLHRDSDQDSILQTRTQPSKNSNDLKRAAVDKLHFQHSTCQLDNCGIEYLGDIHPNGIIPTKYQVLCGRAPSDSSVAAAVRVVDHQRHCLILQHCQQQQLEQPQETVDEEGFQCKFNMMNGNLHLVKSSSSSDARSVAMETFDSNAPCVVTSPAQQQVLGGQQQQANHVHNHLLGKMTTADKKNNLNEQQQMLEQLNGMSINERRFGFGTNGTKNGTMVLTPRITLTSADDMDDVHHCDDMMMDYELNDSGPLSPNFLAVPKLQEVGKERRPPVMVKSV